MRKNPPRGTTSSNRASHWLRVAACSCASLLTLGSARHHVADLPPGFELIEVATGMQWPTSMEFSPDGALFVSEQGGRVRVIRDGALLPTPFITLLVEWTGEHGLAGIAFDPDFASTRHIFLYYSRPDAPFNRLARFAASADNPDVVDPSIPEVVLLDGIPSSDFHNGGALRFAPDGTLLVSTGDAGVPVRAQALEHLNGKILRIHADGSIPADNPFRSDPFARPEIWAYGLRNPFTLSLDAETGRVFTNDVGDRKAEEINEVAGGANYGWPECEGPCGKDGLVDPVIAYRRGEESFGACAITGGTFYRGSQFPEELLGDYFFTDFCAAWIRKVRPIPEVQNFADEMPPSLVDLDVGPEGSLYALSYTEGAVYEVRFVGEGNRSPVAEIDASPTAGHPPLRVVLSAAGSRDPDGDPLSFEWDFGDGSAASTEPALEHVYGTAGAFAVKLTVEDGRGGRASATTTIEVGTPPTASITTPASESRFRAGDEIQFAGHGASAEGVPLPSTALRWTVLLHHHPESDPEHHTHPVLGPIEGVPGGSFSIPFEVHDHDIWYRISLLAFDASGLSGLATRDVAPTTSRITLETDPSDLILRLDGQPRTTPFSEESIAGARRLLAAPQEQATGGVALRFVRWSDGDTSSEREIIVTDEPSHFEAIYEPASN